MISERLKHFGEHLPNTYCSSSTHDVFYLSDEIFALGCPILITIEPVSTAILRMELAPHRKAKTWQSHFEALQEHKLIAKGLSSDRGRGLVQGYQAAYQDFVWCSDYFHEFRELIHLRTILEKPAYAAITEEERIRVFNNARTEANLTKRLQQLDEATQVCEQKMAQYQHLSDVLDLLFPSLYFFEIKTGQPRYQQQAKADILTLMDLLDELSLPKLQVQTNKIREHLDDICSCYQLLFDIQQILLKTIPDEALNLIG